MMENQETRSRYLLEEAVAFASEKHKGSCRKGTVIPYITHPVEAMIIASGMTQSAEVLAAAVLHDTVEDTGTSIKEIREKFGDRVAALVSSESENKREDLPPGDTWKIRKQETITSLMNEKDKDVLIVALADKLSNMRAIARDYASLGDHLWERFNQKDKAEHGWYYGSLVTAFRSLSEQGAWQEYRDLVSKVFGDDACKTFSQ